MQVDGSGTFTFAIKIEGSQNALITIEEGASIRGGANHPLNVGIGLGGNNLAVQNSGLISGQPDNILTIGILGGSSVFGTLPFESGSIVNTATGVIENVEAGIGILARKSSSIENHGRIDVTGLGIQATSVDDDADVSLINTGTIRLKDGDNLLFRKDIDTPRQAISLSQQNGSNGAVIGENYGTIQLQSSGDRAVTLSANDGIFINGGLVSVESGVFDTEPNNPQLSRASIGIRLAGRGTFSFGDADGGKFINLRDGMVKATGEESIAVKVDGATSGARGPRIVENHGLIEATSGTAIQAAEVDDFKVEAQIIFAFPPPVANFSVPAIQIAGVEELIFPELERGPPPLNQVLRVILGPDGRPIYPETVDTPEFGTLRLNKQEDGSFLVTNLDGDMLFDVPSVGLNEAVRNSGSIIGNVNLGLGNDEFASIDNGTVVGMVNGGDGTDSLIFQTDDTQTVDGDQYKEFETLEKRGAGATTMTGQLTVETGTLFEGQFNLSADAILSTDMLTIMEGAGLGGNGLLIGDVVNGGLIGPGESIGSLMIDGSLEQLATGGLLFEIGGAGPGEFDTLIITEEVNLLGGDIILSFIDDYIPSIGDEFDILTAANIFGLENVGISFLGLSGIFEFDLLSFLRDDGTFGLRILTTEAIAQVPAPAGIGFLTAGLFGLGLHRRRKKAA